MKKIILRSLQSRTWICT